MKILKQTKIIIYIVLFLSIIFWVYRIYPYIKLNIPFGYDPWLYKILFLDYINNLPNINFTNISHRTRIAYPPFLWFFWNILYIIWFDIDNLLSFWLGFFSMITSIFIYLNLKKYSKIIALFWIIIFSISIIEYQAFWWNYYKQIIWIIFMLTSIFLLEKKKYLLSIPIIIALFTIHRPAWVYFVISFIIYKTINYLIYRKRGYKDIFIILFAWIIATATYIPVFNEQILSLLKPLLTTADPSVKSWTFFLKEQFGIYNIFIILLSLYWLYKKIIKKDFDYITSSYIAWIIWVWFWLFFYNRFFIFFDIFIILVASYSLWELYKDKKRLFLIIFISFFIIQSSYYLNYINKNNTPLISKVEFEKINKINTIIPSNSTIMVTSKNYSPWIAWYTYKPTIAPWLFELNPWTLNKWKIWWLSDWKIKCKMLNQIKKDYDNLYLWIWERQYKENLNWWQCFKKIINWKHFALFKIEYNNEK